MGMGIERGSCEVTAGEGAVMEGVAKPKRAEGVAVAGDGDGDDGGDAPVAGMPN